MSSNQILEKADNMGPPDPISNPVQLRLKPKGKCHICGNIQRLDDLKGKHYPRQHPGKDIVPLAEDDATTRLLEPDFEPKRRFFKGNQYASSEYKSQALSQRALSERGDPFKLNKRNLKNLDKRQRIPRLKVSKDQELEGNPVEEHEQDTVTDISNQQLHQFLKEHNQNSTDNEMKKSITVITQGRKDMQVMETLAKFEERDNLSLNASELVKISESLTQQSVIQYALKKRDIMIEPTRCVQGFENLNLAQFQGIVFLSLMLGGRLWGGIPRMLALHKDKKESFQFLESILEKHFFSTTVSWILSFPMKLDMQSWEVTCYLQDNPVPQNQEKILRLQSFVRLGPQDFENFVVVSEVALQWMLTDNLVFENMALSPNQLRLSFKEFTSLCSEFAQTVAPFRNQYKELFLQIPLKGWVPKLCEIKSAAHVQDVHSVAHYIKVFNHYYKEAVNEVDMREQNTTISVPLKESKNGPNNLQMAIAQASVELLAKYPQQIHLVKGGQGKSRIAATIAFIAIQTGTVSKVHLIFTNETLMEKDRTDFKMLWQISQLQECVIYHSAIDFVVGEQELIIFDEADDFIYDDTQAFSSFVSNHQCLCLTATSGGSDKEAAEKTILTHIGLKIFYNVLFDDQKEEEVHFEETDLDNYEDIYQYLERQKVIQAVLLYATQDLKQFLQEKGFGFVDLDQCIDHQMLRNLDKTEQNNGHFKVLVSSNKSLTMRGLDYRAPSNGIQLLICNSFSHQREVLQAGYRVGRQNDPFKRLIIKDQSLINHQDAINYKQKLIKFIKDTAPRPVIKRNRATHESQKRNKMPAQTAQQGFQKLFRYQMGNKRRVALLAGGGQAQGNAPQGRTGAQQAEQKGQKIDPEPLY